MLKVFEPSSPLIEVDARTAVIVVHGMLVRSVARELLEWSGLPTEPAQGWAPWKPWLDLHRHIYDTLGADTLYSIGRRVPFAAVFPDESMVDVPTALAAIDVAYHQAHRGGEIGEYRFVNAGREHYQLHCDNPYCNEFDLGIVSSLVERFRGREQYRVRIADRGPGRLWNNACILDVQRVA